MSVPTFDNSESHLANPSILAPDFPLVRALTQALSNLITDNTTVTTAILPGLIQTAFDSNLIASVIGSPSPSTLIKRVVV